MAQYWFKQSYATTESRNFVDSGVMNLVHEVIKLHDSHPVNIQTQQTKEFHREIMNAGGSLGFPVSTLIYFQALILKSFPTAELSNTRQFDGTRQEKTSMAQWYDTGLDIQYNDSKASDIGKKPNDKKALQAFRKRIIHGLCKRHHGLIIREIYSAPHTGPVDL
ncbi:hypothetical protein EYC84_010931 [Monilinia fructicola]|uniref:Uncharacterized protein n=1 Tax=Monilinia fructicola TaxID=38448 RepID=A0A5M9J6R0_MONFR|nr:hypothetical protein EYC84_010931 [Monilinia fructicola]